MQDTDRVDEPDNLDGCILNFDDPEKNTSDDEIDALVLFADVDFEDPVAVVARSGAWMALFGSSDV